MGVNPRLHGHNLLWSSFVFQINKQRSFSTEEAESGRVLRTLASFGLLVICNHKAWKQGWKYLPSWYEQANHFAWVKNAVPAEVESAYCSFRGSALVLSTPIGWLTAVHKCTSTRPDTLFWPSEASTHRWPTLKWIHVYTFFVLLEEKWTQFLLSSI